MLDIPRTTRALLALAGEAAPGPALDVASFQGAVARETGCTYASVDLIAFAQATKNGVASVLHTDQLPEGPFSTIFFDAREYDPAFAAETVMQAAARLTPAGLLITTAGEADLTPHFGSVEPHGEAFIARKPHPGATVGEPEWPVYTAEFGGHSYHFQSGPGIFSPRGLDEGTRFMLSEIRVTEPGLKFLDLGCGAGAVSRIASEAWGCQVTAVDVNARALRLTALNAPAAEVVASDGFSALSGRQFDIIASNPPYHTDFGVAKAFIEGAYAHLTPGGQLYLVIKRADWYVQKVRNVFGGCRVAEHDGYTVITTEKRERKAAPITAPVPATTRKHARRMAEAAKTKRRRP